MNRPLYAANVTEGSKTNVWTFDDADRVSTYQDSENNLIQYGYDQNGNLTNLVYPGGHAVAYSYDALNRLTSMTDWANRQTSFEYDLAGQVTAIRRPNGTVRSIGYDAAGETTNITETTAGNVPITAFKLEWNAAARVQREWSGPPPHRVTPPTRTATYDDDNRIATFNGQGVVYDADGNLTSGPLTNATPSAYGYDARNRLLSAGGLTYTYDPAGNRVAVTNAGVATKYVVNPNAVLSQVLMRVRNGVSTYYVYGLGLLYEVTETAGSTNILMYHFDYRGSTVALTDSAGNVTDRAEYSAYGLLTYRGGTTDTPFLFNGRYGVMTDASGLLYMRARYYNPYLCRFLNPDPAGFAGGLNFYCFADGNPVSRMDPFGLDGNPISGPDGPVGPATLYEPGGALYIPTPLPPPGPGTYLAGGAVIGVGGAAAVTVGGPLVFALLTKLGVSAAAASATVTTTLAVTGLAGGAATVLDLAQNTSAGNWNDVAFDIGTLGGAAVFGGIGGGRFIANHASPTPSTVPRSLNPFTADYASTPTAPQGYGFERHPELPLLKDLWNFMGTGPTPSSAGGSATATAAALGLLAACRA